MHFKKINLTLLVVILIISASCTKETSSDDQLIQLAKKIHDSALTLDTHVDIAGSQYATEKLDPGIDHPRLRCDLVKMNKGRLDGVFLAVYVGQPNELNEEVYKEAYERALQNFEAIHRLTKKYPDRCELATSPADFRRIEKTGKRVIMIGIENGYPVGTDLAKLKEYYDLGARYITLSHSKHNQICDSSSPDKPKHDGISDFGKKVVAEMNRLGMICDVSHISVKSFNDLIEITKAPIMASHSGCYALNPHSRNLTDDQLRALTKNGGVIQIVALTSFLKEESEEHKKAMKQLREELELPSWDELYKMPREKREAFRPKLNEYRKRRREIEKKIPGATVKDYVDHIDHAVKIAGINHVGIGTDFDGGGGISGFQNHAEAFNVTLELVRRGYSEEDIKRIWGSNLLRAWGEVERVASELQKLPL